MDDYRAGQDAVALMRQYADRLILLHQKDFPTDSGEPPNLYDGVVSPTQHITTETFEAVKDALTFVEVGTGRLPTQDRIDFADAAPLLEYVLLEQDHSTHEEFTSIPISKREFDACQRISWS